MVIVLSEIVVYFVFSKSDAKYNLHTPSTTDPVKHLPPTSSKNCGFDEFSVILKLISSESSPPSVSIFPIGYSV